jgi:glycosyltransferase involved in cell wall biosynthesis
MPKESSWKIPLWLRFQDRYERWQTFHADAIVSPSYALANHLSLSWVIPRSRFTVLPNPIDTELFCTSDSIEQERKREILYVGRLQYNKGGFDLAESVVPLLSEYPELTVRLVGMDAESPKRFRGNGDKASEAILSLIPREYHNRIIFTNHVPVPELVSFHQKALCAVMPTRGFESFSYTVLEPMSCGCPVVATHCGGPAEIITDGVDGLLVPPGDTKALTIALERLVKDQQLRAKLALEARRTAERRFAIPVVIPQIVKLYEDVISNWKKKAS